MFWCEEKEEKDKKTYSNPSLDRVTNPCKDRRNLVKKKNKLYSIFDILSGPFLQFVAVLCSRGVSYVLVDPRRASSGRHFRLLRVYMTSGGGSVIHSRPPPYARFSKVVIRIDLRYSVRYRPYTSPWTFLFLKHYAYSNSFYRVLGAWTFSSFSSLHIQS